MLLPVARPGAQEAPAATLTVADIEEALVRMDALAAFFGAFAERETNEFASGRWHRLGINYQGTAANLRRSLAAGRLAIADLPHGRRSALADNGRMVIDQTLDGRWWRLPEGPAAEAQLRDLLVPALIEALAQRRLPQDWPWLADHLRAVGGLVAASQDPMARPLLARYFQAKDAYLWLAMRRIGEGDPVARQGLARRQQATFEAVRAMESGMAATLGAADAGRLQRDWTDYVAQVDGFAVTRGWVLLDPALRQTQLGKAAREAGDAVDQAAAEVVASAPRSALAAARAEAEERQQPAPAKPRAEPPAEPPAVTLGDLVAQAPADADEDGKAEPEPLETQAGEVPEAETPRARVPEPEDEAAQREVATLQQKVDALREELDVRGAETARLEAALAAEREKQEVAERERQEAAEREIQKTAERERMQAAERERLAAAVEQERLAAAERQRLAVEEAAARAAAHSAAQSQRSTDALTTLLARMERRQLYSLAAVAVIVLAVVFGALLLFWLRGRRRFIALEAGPPLLAAPAVAGRDVSLPIPPRPVIDVTEAAAPKVVEEPVAPDLPTAPEAAEAAPAAEAVPLPSLSLKPGQQITVSGVMPSTAAAKAGMEAARVRRDAAQAVADAPPAAEPDDDAAPLGDEATAAAHPIVKALRDGNLPLFEMLFSELTDLHSPQLQRIVYGGRGEDLAIVCRAVGVDKLLFGSIFLLTDHLRSGGPEEEADRTTAILRMYDRMPPETAQKVLAKWQRNWGGLQRGQHKEVASDVH